MTNPLKTIRYLLTKLVQVVCRIPEEVSQKSYASDWYNQIMLRSQCFQMVLLCWVFSFSFINSTAERYSLNLPKQIVPSDPYGRHTEILE